MSADYFPPNGWEYVAEHSLTHDPYGGTSMDKPMCPPEALADRGAEAIARMREFLGEGDHRPTDADLEKLRAELNRRFDVPKH